MNVLTSLLLIGVSAPPAKAALEEEIVILTSDDIERKRSPVFFAVHRVGETGFSIDFSLATSTSSGLMSDLAPYQLCVLKQRLNPADLSTQLSQTHLIARTELRREARTTFEVRKEEISNSALLVYLAAETHSGLRRVRGFCLPLTELMKTVRMTSRHPLPASHPPFVR